MPGGASGLWAAECASTDRAEHSWPLETRRLRKRVTCVTHVMLQVQELVWPSTKASAFIKGRGAVDLSTGRADRIGGLARPRVSGDKGSWTSPLRLDTQRNNEFRVMDAVWGDKATGRFDVDLRAASCQRKEGPIVLGGGHTWLLQTEPSRVPANILDALHGTRARYRGP